MINSVIIRILSITLHDWYIYLQWGAVIFTAATIIVGRMVNNESAQQIKNLEEQSLETKKALSQSEIRRLELEATVQPRYIKYDDAVRVSAAMAKFHGSGVLIASFWIDAESARLARQIKLALNNAQLGIGGAAESRTFDLIGQYPQLAGALFNGGGLPEGFTIHEGIEIWGNDKTAAQALAESLGKVKEIGKVSLTTKPIVGLEAYGTPALCVFVGVKRPPSGEAKYSDNIE